MRRPRRMLGAYGSAAALLALLISGCALTVGREETPPPPAAVPDAVPAAAAPTVEQVGDASWYGPAQDGKETASGETFDQNKLTAAHRTLPLGSKAVVTNLENGKSVEVKINDRGPYAKGRKIDLSRAAARQIGMSTAGGGEGEDRDEAPPTREQEDAAEEPGRAPGGGESGRSGGLAAVVLVPEATTRQAQGRANG